MRINHNLAALNSYRQLSSNTVAQGKSLEKLSSGLRINKAGDDAAGLAISEKMRGQIRGLDQATRNSQDGISMIQTAEGALNETHSMLQRMRELTVQANNDTNNAQDRTSIQLEITQLQTEITSIATRTQFNTKTLLDGSLGVKAYASVGGAAAGLISTAGASISLSGVSSTAVISVTMVAGSSTVTATYNGISQSINVGNTSAIAAGTVMNFDHVGLKINIAGVTEFSTAFGGASNVINADTTAQTANFQIDANSNTVSTLSISINAMDANSIGKGGAAGAVSAVSFVNVTNKSFAQNIASIDQAIKDVSDTRANLGAWQNRLEHTIANLGTSSENLTAAESRVRDVDMAKEMMEFTKNNILSQASTAMLAQANQQPQGVLQLLR